MGGALAGLHQIIQFLQILFFYGVLAIVLLMLYRVSKEVGDLKRSLADMEERILLAMLPRNAKPDNPEHV
jgi:hypothetical protein